MWTERKIAFVTATMFIVVGLIMFIVGASSGSTDNGYFVVGLVLFLVGCIGALLVYKYWKNEDYSDSDDSDDSDYDKQNSVAVHDKDKINLLRSVTFNGENIATLSSTITLSTLRHHVYFVTNPLTDVTIGDRTREVTARSHDRVTARSHDRVTAGSHDTVTRWYVHMLPDEENIQKHLRLVNSAIQKNIGVESIRAEVFEYDGIHYIIHEFRRFYIPLSRDVLKNVTDEKRKSIAESIVSIIERLYENGFSCDIDRLNDFDVRLFADKMPEVVLASVGNIRELGQGNDFRAACYESLMGDSDDVMSDIFFTALNNIIEKNKVK